MKYLSLDLETTGLDPAVDQVLEIAAIVDDLSKPLEDNLPTFHAYIQHDRITGHPKALQMNAKIIDIIAEGKHPDLLPALNAVSNLKYFLKTHFGKEKITVAGKNFSGFDKPFMDSFIATTCAASGYAAIKLNFHHRAFDPGTNFFRMGDKAIPDLQECIIRAGIDPKLFHFHNAVDDALAVIQLIRHINP